MRAGKKTEAETGKTRPCIVYVKNLKEAETTDIINAPTATGNQTKTLRRVAAKGPTRRIQQKEKGREFERERELVELEREKTRATRTSRRAASIAIATTPTTVATRSRNVKGVPATVPRVILKTTTATIQQQEQQQEQQVKLLSKRRNTALPVARSITPLGKRRDTTRHCLDIEPKSKMYKPTKIAVTPTVATPPPTIAASRSRRSIKPNPKYASDDLVTPKYVAALAANETSYNKRSGGAGKHIYAVNMDDEDEDLHDLIEEDNDDELHDAAFNPQLHKSDDEDDISEIEFEQPLRREKVPPKRGRGRPPKNPNAATAGSNTPSSAGRGPSQAGRGGVTQLQQLRRTIAAAGNLARSGGPPIGSKRKLDDQSDTPIARKRMATELSARAPPVINGSTSVAKTATIGLSGNQAKSKLILGNNTSNSGSGGSGVRLLQAAATKPVQRAGSNFKQNTAGTGAVAASTTVARGGATGGLARTSTATRQVTTPAAVKVHKAGGAASGATENDDVPTFTIVNIADIINQDDVLISRSSSSANNNNNNKNSTNNSSSNNNNNSNKKLSSAMRNNNNSRSNQLQSSTPSRSSPTTASNSSNSISNLGNKRLKTTTAGTAGGAVTTATRTGTSNKTSSEGVNHKQNSLVVTVAQSKPRPRILNTEMGKKNQPIMKPLMSMGKELCPMPDGADTEDEDISQELAEEDMNISPPAAIGKSNVQSRAVRRVQTAKWLPTTRRNVLSTTTTSNTQRQQVQQQQQHLGVATDRKLTKLLGESTDDDVFKKPASPNTMRRSKENEDDPAIKVATVAATAAAGSSVSATATETEIEGKQPKYFPPETTTYVEEDGRIVKKITCYETWHVISTPKESFNKTRQQRTCLELPLVKLANVAARIKVPSSKWTSKVTLYKVSPTLMQRQTMTIFTGDLKSYNIPEEERHKYQPSCVLFRRSVLDRSKCRVPFDRAIIFKNKCFYANIEGKHVNLLGAPEVVNSIKDVEILIDIVDTLSLSSDLVEMVTSK